MSKAYFRTSYGLILLTVTMAVSGQVSAGDAAAEKDEHFSISTLSVADDLLHIISRDLDADGLSDILAIHRKGLEPDETRWLSVFWQSEGGSFSTAPDQSWEIDTMAVVVDTGQLDGDPAAEICYLSPDGVKYYDFVGDKFDTDPSMLIKSAGLTVFPSKRSIPAVDFVKDWNDDGIEEVGIFRFEGISIFSPDSTGSFTRENMISVELLTNMYGSRMVGEEEEVSGLRASFSFPATRLIDHDNDGRKDIIAVRGDRVVVYPMLENGNFTEKPTVDMMFDVRTQQEKIENTAFAQTVVDDLNNDGFADAVVTKQSSRGLSNFRCAINIYYGGVEGFSDTPEQVIISEGSASEATILRDVNGDGRLDMILPSIKISIKSIVRFLLTRSVPINFNIFLLHDDNRYSDRPDFSKEVKFKIDFSGETDVQAISLNGDYNSDGKKDFAFGTGEEELSLFIGVSGEEDRIFSKKPVATIEVPAFGELISRDLNGDEYSDMIIYYPQSKEKKGTIQILMNNRKF